MAGQAGVLAHISAAQLVHRNGLGSRHRPRLAEGPVLTIYEKRRRVTEIAVKTVAHLTVVAAAVERGTVKRVATKVRLHNC